LEMMSKMSTCVSNKQCDLIYRIVILLIPVLAVFISVDNNRNEIDPDRLMNGLDSFTSSAERVSLHYFLSRYVRKVYPDTEIMRDLKNNEGLSFINKITPSDIAFIISVIKNGQNVWDESIRVRTLGMAVHGEKGPKAKPLFTGGKGKKRGRNESME
jgi:hypothetical protein